MGYYFLEIAYQRAQPSAQMSNEHSDEWYPTSDDQTVDVRGPLTEASVLDEFDIETSYGAHCECIVLKHLQDRADRPTEFVGVSKLSCRLCQEYFVATAAHMGAGYHTRGSHGQLAMWRCPPDSSTEVRRLLGVKLLAIVKEEMNSKSKAIKDARSLSQGSLPVKRGGAADPSSKMFGFGCRQYPSDEPFHSSPRCGC